MARKIAQRVRALSRITVVALAAVATMGASLGLVLMPHSEATYAHQHDSESAIEEAYPCQGHSCGCKSAADCRSHCCCFGPALRSPAPPPPSDAPSTQLSWRDASCAGIASWIMTLQKTGWLPMTPSVSPIETPERERVQPLFSKPPACRALAVDPPPPRLSA